MNERMNERIKFLVAPSVNVGRLRYIVRILLEINTLIFSLSSIEYHM